MSIPPRPTTIQPRAVKLLRAGIAIQEVRHATPETDIAGRQRLSDIEAAIRYEVRRLEGEPDDDR